MMQRTTLHQTESVFLGSQGLPLYYQCWHGSQPPRAVVVLVHGLGSHSGLFDNIVAGLLPQGFILYALDLRGHGRSPGQRGYINSWNEFREDINLFLDHIHRGQQQPLHQDGAAESSLPCVLVGHSLGGLIVLDYAIRHPHKLASIVAIAPALGAVGVPPLKLAVGKILSNLWPRFSLSTGLNHACASRDPAVINRYKQDSLRHSKGTARLATEFLDTTAWVDDHAAHLQCPLLILHGTADAVALPEGSDRFFQKVEIEHKARYEYSGAYHDLHNDINHPRVIQDLLEWLNVQLSRHSALPAYQSTLSA